MLALHDVETLATYFCFEKAVVDSMKRSKIPGLDMVSELENRGVISREGISRLVDALKLCNRAGIASKVEYSYQENVSSNRGSPLTLKGNVIIRH